MTGSGMCQRNEAIIRPCSSVVGNLGVKSDGLKKKEVCDIYEWYNNNISQGLARTHGTRLSSRQLQVWVSLDWLHWYRRQRAAVCRGIDTAVTAALPSSSGCACSRSALTLDVTSGRNCTIRKQTSVNCVDSLPICAVKPS